MKLVFWLMLALSQVSFASDALIECDFTSENWFQQFNSFKKPPKTTGLNYMERVYDADKKNSAGVAFSLDLKARETQWMKRTLKGL